MKLITEIFEQDITPDAKQIDESGFRERKASRAVFFDNEGKVALLNVGKHNYHKLPGGGIDEGEDIHVALERELMEEIGCKGKVLAEVGKVVEHRNEFEMIQISYCYTAELIGYKGQPDFTESEINNEFSIVWADSLNQAIELLNNDDPDDYEGRFIKIRDTAILEAASNVISQQ
jgi:8-oxo-dGTP diphosphatase